MDCAAGLSNHQVPNTILHATEHGCKRRERLFRRPEGFRRVFSRFDKLDAMFLEFVVFALIIDTLRSVNTP